MCIRMSIVAKEGEGEEGYLPTTEEEIIAFRAVFDPRKIQPKMITQIVQKMLA